MKYPGANCDHPYITLADRDILKGYLTGDVEQDEAFRIIQPLTDWFKERKLYMDYGAMYVTWREGFIRGIVENVDV